MDDDVDIKTTKYMTVRTIIETLKILKGELEKIKGTSADVFPELAVTVGHIINFMTQLNADNDMLSSRLDDALEQNLLFSRHNDALKEHVDRLIKDKDASLEVIMRLKADIDKKETDAE